MAFQLAPSGTQEYLAQGFRRICQCDEFGLLYGPFVEHRACEHGLRNRAVPSQWGWGYADRNLLKEVWLCLFRQLPRWD